MIEVASARTTRAASTIDLAAFFFELVVEVMSFSKFCELYSIFVRLIWQNYLSQDRTLGFFTDKPHWL